jgi:uncharacterized protein YicC (UPF0701 family)
VTAKRKKLTKAKPRRSPQWIRIKLPPPRADWHQIAEACGSLEMAIGNYQIADCSWPEVMGCVFGLAEEMVENRRASGAKLATIFYRHVAEISARLENCQAWHDPDAVEEARRKVEAMDRDSQEAK